MNIINYDINKLISDIDNITECEIELNQLNKILLENGVDEFYDFIRGSDYKAWIKKWFKIMKNNCRKLIKKQENIIKEVVEDINDINNYSTEYKVDESTILNYNEYLNKYLKT